MLLGTTVGVKKSADEIDSLLAEGEEVLRSEHASTPSVAYPKRRLDEALAKTWALKAKRALKVVDDGDGTFTAPAKRLAESPWTIDFGNELMATLRAARDLTSTTEDESIGGAAPDALATVLRICERFHAVAVQFARTTHGRTAWAIKDEYDVQYVLGGLLKVPYDDVRAEEQTPSTAGAATRMDFLLKAQRIALETKMARQGLDTKKIGEELAIDIKKYAAHPDCDTLVCLVYDPKHELQNPESLQDLAGKQGRLDVHVVVCPRR